MINIDTAVSFLLGRSAEPADLSQFEATGIIKLPVEEISARNLRQLPGGEVLRLDNFPDGKTFFSALEFSQLLPFGYEVLDQLVDFPKLSQVDRVLDRTHEFIIVPDVYVFRGSLEQIDLSSSGYRVISAGGGKWKVGVIGPATQFSKVGQPARPDLLKRMTVYHDVMPAFRDGNGHVRLFVPGRVDIWFTRDTIQLRCLEIIKTCGLKPMPASISEHRMGLWRAEVTDTNVGSLRAMVNAFELLKSYEEVTLAEPDEFAEDDFVPLPVTKMAMPTPPSFTSIQNEFLSMAQQRWSAKAIKLAQGHSITRGASSVKVFVIDSGIDSDHPNIVNALWEGWHGEDLNFNIDDAPEVISPEEDTISHGTAVASLAVGQGGDGPQGVAPGCKLVPIKIAGAPLSAGYGLRAAAIHKALDLLDTHERGVINLSWRTAGEHLGIREALRRAQQMGVPVVAASGNYYPFENATSDEILYPAAHAHQEPRLDNIVSTGAVNASLERASYSYFGSVSVTVAAPGGEVGGIGNGLYAATIGGSYGYVAGTSFAAPQVAGLIALILSRDPTLTAVEAIQRVTFNANPVGNEAFPLGHGIIDVSSALSASTREVTDASPSTGLVNINQAGVDLLASLEPLSFWHAEGIVEYRDAHGPYPTAWHLVSTGRIGFPIIQRLLPLVLV